MPNEISYTYERLCDFIHENKIEQIIGEGASATPYLRLVRKAYRQRYGKEARPLTLVSTGILPKFASTKGKSDQEIHIEIARHIAEYRPTLKEIPSLLLSEFTYSGNQLNKLSGALKVLNIPHKKAIMNPWITPGVDFYGTIRRQDLVYLNLSGQYDFTDKTNPNKDLRNYELEGLNPKQVKIKKPNTKNAVLPEEFPSEVHAKCTYLSELQIF